MEVTEQRDVNKKETSGWKIVAMEVVSNWSRHVNEINYTILDSKWFNWSKVVIEIADVVME